MFYPEGEILTTRVVRTWSEFGVSSLASKKSRRKIMSNAFWWDQNPFGGNKETMFAFFPGRFLSKSYLLLVVCSPCSRD